MKRDCKLQPVATKHQTKEWSFNPDNKHLHFCVCMIKIHLKRVKNDESTTIINNK